jgi:hypothetical protein
MTLSFTALSIDITDQEILDDLLYPGGPERGAR